jgi:uncharacterized membrane protein
MGQFKMPNRATSVCRNHFVNFTAALLPMALLSDVLLRISHRESLRAVGSWLMVYAAAVTPFTVLAGWWWKAAGSADHGRVMVVHQLLASSAAVLFVFLAVWRWRIHKGGLFPTIPYLVVALLVFLAVVYQGSLGGRMAFGIDFSLRRLTTEP